MYVGENVTETKKEFDSVEDYGLVKVRKSEKYVILPGSFMLIKPTVYHVNQLEQGSVKLVFKIETPE
jgi:beta-galactosidase beta subunit